MDFSGNFCKYQENANYYSLVSGNKMSLQCYAPFIYFRTNQIRHTKINYFACKCEQFKGDCKNTWKQLNNIISINRICKRNIINKINENDITNET